MSIHCKKALLDTQPLKVVDTEALAFTAHTWLYPVQLQLSFVASRGRCWCTVAHQAGCSVLWLQSLAEEEGYHEGHS